MKCALIIFTRVPKPGQTKTRLEKMLTKEECASLHENMIRDEAALTDTKQWDTFVYYTPADAQERIIELIPGAMGYEPQRDVEFGTRMSECIGEILDRGYGACVLIGTDIPAINKDIIEKAFAILDKEDVVIGATEDEGYYLIGMKILHKGIFANQTYGTGSVYQDTLEKIRDCECSYGTLSVLRDIDEPEDLKEYWTCRADRYPEMEHTWKYLKQLHDRYDLSKERT